MNAVLLHNCARAMQRLVCAKRSMNASHQVGIMSTLHSLSRLLVALPVLFGISSNAVAVDGFPIRVTKDSATIQVGNRIVGKVKIDTLLWATSFSKDNKWVSVKVPAVDRRGWMSVNNAANLNIPEEYQEDWKQAVGYGARWKEDIDAGNAEGAATTAENAAADMDRILTQTVGPLTVGYPPIGVALNQAGVARMRSGKWPEAQALFERALEIATSSLGSQHLSTCVSQANLGEAFVLQGQWIEGISAFESSIPILDKLPTPDVHMESFYVRYATALANQHRVFDAGVIFEKALATVETKQGRFAQSVATIAAIYATMLDTAGHRKEAVEQLRRARLVYLNHVQKHNPLMLDVLNRLSAISARAGDFTASVQYATEAIETHSELDKPGPLRLGSAFNNLGFAQARLGQFAEATRSLNEATQLIEESTEEAAVVRSFPIKNQGILAMEQEQLDEAEALFRKALAIRQAAPGDNEVSIADAQTLLGEVALRDGRNEAATQHLFTAVKSQATHIGIDHPDCRSNILLLQQALKDDTAGNEELSRLIAESRERQRILALGEWSESTTSHDSIGADYRLANILAGKPATAPETKYYALEVTSDNAPVRSGGKTVANLRRGTTVYGFRAAGKSGLIKVPDQNVVGWVSENHLREATYSQQTQRRLQEADQLLEKAWKLHESGQSKQAATITRQALKDYESEVGLDNPWVGSICYTLSTVLTSTGEINEAVDLCLRAETILVRTLGDHHSETAMARNNLAQAMQAAGRWKEALRPASLGMKTLLAMGSDHQGDVSMIAGNLGSILGSLSRFEEAREYLEYSLEVSRKANEEQHAMTARAYTTIGKLHSVLYESESAEAAHRKGYEIYKAVYGENHPETTEAMQWYGAALINNLQIDAGRRMIETATAINHRERGPNDLGSIDSDYAQANVLLNVGDAEAAEPLIHSVIGRANQQLGPHHPTTLVYRETLLKSLYLAQNFEAALAEAQDILKLRQKHIGEDHYDTIMSYNAIGVCNAAVGRLTAARLAYERSLQLALANLGAGHPDVSVLQYNIGEVAWFAGDYAAAVPRIQQSILQFRLDTNTDLQHSIFARTTLGHIDAAQNDPRAAVATFGDAARRGFEYLAKVLPAFSEKEQLAFLSSEFRDMLHSWLSLLPEFSGDTAVALNTATWNLNMKASSHELLATQAKINQGFKAADRTAFRRLLQTREQLARLALKSVRPDAQSEHAAGMARLTAEEAALSRTLGQASALLVSPRRWTEVAEVQQHIPQNTVMVDFARVRQANYHATSSMDRWKGERYLAWVIPPAGKGAVLGLDIGPADEIDQLITNALNASCSGDAIKSISADGEITAEQTTREVLASLAEKLWQPLQEHLIGVESVVISPDGQLWTVPWDALPISENKLVLEEYAVRLVVSGRDVLSAVSPTQQSNSPNAPIIVADPRFDLAPASLKTASTAGSRDQRRSVGNRLSTIYRNAARLPGTAQEAEAIRASVAKFAGNEPIVHLDQAAREGVVKSAQSPYCMVLSTHGFFVESQSDHKGNDKLIGGNRIVENPLLRCGLLLAGCQHADQVSPDSDDGVLTGLEIVGTNLRETQLVVLSACETGLGTVRNGEGVAGLRQAFLLAGAESVVASLWKVDDTSTARLMDDFFRNLAQGMSRSAALRQAKLTRIRARRERNGAAHPFFWAAFTLTGQE